MSRLERKALVVLGMHRSGTSATAGVLSLLGASEPRHLMPPTPDNPKGYWESVLMMSFHDELLQAAGSAWDDWSPIPDSWFESADAQEARARIPDLVSEEYGDAGVLLLKDPRLCRLMPLWAPALVDEDVEPLLVLTLRDAMDVAESLRARDGFDLRRGLLLWLRHVLDAERHSRGMRRTFLRYDDLLTNWRPEVARIATELAIDWSCPPDRSASAIDDLLDRSLRHHRSGDTTRSCPDGLLQSWVAAVSAAVTELCRAGADTEHAFAALDGVREELDRAATTFREPLRHELHQLRTSASDARVELARVNRASALGQEELAAARKALEEEQLITAGQAARLSDLEGKLMEMHRRNQERVEELAMLTRRTLRAEQRLLRATAERKREVSRLRARMRRQKAQLAARGQELVAMQESTSWQVTAPLRNLSARVRAAGPSSPDSGRKN